MWHSKIVVQTGILRCFFFSAIFRYTSADYSAIFDLETDPMETINLLDVTDASISASNRVLLASLLDMGFLGKTEIPDYSVAEEAWNVSGGITPWINTSQYTFLPEIEEKYSYGGAPNIVFFLADDWGYNDAGYQSTYLNWTTPTIDSAASQGIRLSNYFTHELCVPSRAALFTGRYASRFGMHGDNNLLAELPLSETTLMEELKSAGYRNYLIGKWNMGMSTTGKLPTYRGFDYFYGFYSAYIDYYKKTYEGHIDLHEDAEDLLSFANSRELSESEFTAYLYSTKAEKIIADHAVNYAGSPMFLMYSNQLIHFPWEAPERFVDRCSNEQRGTNATIYCAMNLVLDEAFANLTCALETYGMTKNTLIVVASDNGGAEEMTGNSYPWRGGKNSAFRGGTQVPAFIFGDVIPEYLRGSTYSGQIHVTDWLPTFMALATHGKWGENGMNGAQIDGANMWDAVIANESSPHPEIVHYLDDENHFAYQKNLRKSMIVTRLKNFAIPEDSSGVDEYPDGSLISCQEPNYMLLQYPDDDSFWAAQGETSTFFILISSFLLLSTCLFTISVIVKRVIVLQQNKEMVLDKGSDFNGFPSHKMGSTFGSDVIDCDVGESMPLLRPPTTVN